jgi:hypothetical protein
MCETGPKLKPFFFIKKLELKVIQFLQKLKKGRNHPTVVTSYNLIIHEPKLS